MTMVFCRGCGKEIHETAPICPHCGAPQTVQSEQSGNDSSAWDWYLVSFKKYATFQGRARRKEYWYFVLFYWIISIALAFTDSAMGTLDENTGLGLLSGIYSIGSFLPALSVYVRRLHDTNHSGWWVLVPLIPLIFLVSDTKRGPNKYGLPPK
jgi:uncharacterized membrane protein YhaH (DUF805 family)